jgi:hypothetical protein
VRRGISGIVLMLFAFAPVLLGIGSRHMPGIEAGMRCRWCCSSNYRLTRSARAGGGVLRRSRTRRDPVQISVASQDLSASWRLNSRPMLRMARQSRREGAVGVVLAIVLGRSSGADDFLPLLVITCSCRFLAGCIRGARGQQALAAIVAGVVTMFSFPPQATGVYLWPIRPCRPDRRRGLLRAVAAFAEPEKTAG